MSDATQAPTQLLNIDDYQRRAADTMSTSAYEYYAGGAHDEITLAENCDAYGQIHLKYRVMVDVSRRDAATTVLGTPLSMPILVAPTAFHRLAHDQGELATARAAAAAGTIMTVSSLSNTPIEAIADATEGPLWFQLYIYRDRGLTKDLVQRVEAAGCAAIVLTVDAPVLGTRERDVRNRFSLPEGLTVENATGLNTLPADTGGSGLASYFASLLDPAITWDDIGWLRSITDLPILIKGVVRGDDADRAVEEGVAGVIVSNHGGRQLDTSPPTILALPEVLDAVEGRAEVLVDGGIRRGTDVIKALACGARAVLVGRPVLWGLAVDGQDGVGAILDLLRTELDMAMALCGCRDIDEITLDLLT